MKEALEVIAGLEASGLVRRFAIGGGVAVVFHAEPLLTYDLNVFVLLPESGGSGLVDPSPLYRHLVEEQGYVADGERIVIGGVPVQFIVFGKRPRGWCGRSTWRRSCSRRGEPRTASGWSCCAPRRRWTIPFSAIS